MNNLKTKRLIVKTRSAVSSIGLIIFLIMFLLIGIFNENKITSWYLNLPGDITDDTKTRVSRWVELNKSTLFHLGMITILMIPFTIMWIKHFN